MPRPKPICHLPRCYGPTGVDSGRRERRLEMGDRRLVAECEGGRAPTTGGGQKPVGGQANGRADAGSLLLLDCHPHARAEAKGGGQRLGRV
jgi:hypothetical protein